MRPESPDLRRCVWKEHPDNPLISAPGREWIIADPSALMPADSPDGKFHLFAHSLRGIHHFISDDAARWQRIEGPLFPGLRPFIFKENGYHLFYERFVRPWQTVVAVRSSQDLRTWSEPKTLLAPTFPWEGRLLRFNGNPCLVKLDGRYRLYYSASWSWLKDCYFPEPRYIGAAESTDLFGPYEKRPIPIISPSADVPWRNLGAGSIKVLPPANGLPWLALSNGIYVDAQGRSRSDIRLLESDDGLAWREALDHAVVSPEPGWKKALVYAISITFHEDRALLYFNARDGWFRGSERIGLAIGQPAEG